MRPNRHSHWILAGAMLVSLAACQPQAADTGANASLETADQKASYGIGRNIGQGLAPMADRIDIDAFAAGLRDALAESESAVPQAELDSTLQAFQMDLQQAQQQQMAAEAETNKAAADSFMAANGEKEGVQTTDSGLEYQVIEAGDGPKPGPDDTVTIHYSGTLPDGTKFDSSYDRGQPATFSVQGVIPGFSEGLQLMPVGSKYKLFIPPDLGYGPRGQGPIPPNSALVFEVEMLSIGS
ncbi:MAG: FKBP-type peptidyl-prolyl cis-trans isomerase [Gemmatimonadales bacterium]